MIKPVEIVEAKPYSIVCLFSNGETRQLNMEPFLTEQKNIAGISKLFDEKIFGQVSIGEVGQLLWKDIVTMRDENGELISAEYDVSPEFAYQQSIPV
jgi:hypothetical protein